MLFIQSSNDRGVLTCKTVSRITYTVLVETLNPAQSINRGACDSLYSLKYKFTVFLCSLVYIRCSDGLVFFENLPYEAQNLDSAGPESLRQLDVEVAVR